jgi:hypothetical protein
MAAPGAAVPPDVAQRLRFGRVPLANDDALVEIEPAAPALPCAAAQVRIARRRRMIADDGGALADAAESNAVSARTVRGR